MDKQTALKIYEDDFLKWWDSHKESIAVVSGRPFSDMETVFRLAYMEGWISATKAYSEKMGETLTPTKD